MASATSVVKASAVLPSVYRFLLTNVESLFAFGGVIMVLVKPEEYVKALTREHVASIDTATNFVYTQLGGGWAVIVFLEAVVMRYVDDVRVWKLLCWAILMSDALYTHSMAQAVGGWAEWAVLSNWTLNDWVAAATTWPFVLTRLAIVLGIGYRKNNGLKRS
ncbi:hypothetical protein CERZMDRAFT_102254 [Cercospora zeae-maydis SCOH1-5]|uniref:DUF7704 domain-containing protein n=1 Tax=Cercospora zeae-maydis SCOH1-5 TaxID=717836 RepID=A0A6A6F1C8_9PEZI|nr:hypothetical protein CERZMDRAFT_102254 [Cercospora zeae-maydis SCOH1-5]